MGQTSGLVTHSRALLFPFPCEGSSLLLKRSLFLWDSIYIPYFNGVEQYFNDETKYLLANNLLTIVDLSEYPFDEPLKYGNTAFDSLTNNLDAAKDLNLTMKRVSPNLFSQLTEFGKSYIPIIQLHTILSERKLITLTDDVKAILTDLFTFAMISFVLVKSLELSNSTIITPSTELHVKLVNMASMFIDNHAFSKDYSGLLLDVTIPFISSQKLNNMSFDNIIKYRDCNKEYRDIVLIKLNEYLQNISEIDDPNEFRIQLDIARETFNRELSGTRLVREALRLAGKTAYLKVSVPTYLTLVATGLGTLFDRLASTSPIGQAIGSSTGYILDLVLSSANVYAENRVKMHEFKSKYPLHYLLP